MHMERPSPLGVALSLRQLGVNATSKGRTSENERNHYGLVGKYAFIIEAPFPNATII